MCLITESALVGDPGKRKISLPDQVQGVFYADFTDVHAEGTFIVTAEML